MSSSAAVRCWRATCALTAAHVFGRTWPPPGTAQRARAVGHWGCDPGIAWIIAHLGAAWPTAEEALVVIIGTGHATSFVFAHDALTESMPASAISAATARYGQPDGDPAELLGSPDVPYIGGELGPALGVSQAIAAARPERIVVSVVGDGEIETPVALAALAHHHVLLEGTGAHWLPVINANGARMGSTSRFNGADLDRILVAFGYAVVRSGTDAEEASAAAGRALSCAKAGNRVAWISETEKGWPAPVEFGGRPFRGHLAHKAGGLPIADPGFAGELDEWFAWCAADVFDHEGVPTADVVETARRISLRLPTSEASRPRETLKQQRVEHPDTLWRSPVRAVDEVLARNGVLVLSPDEAASNRLETCLDAGLVREVLAEELCAAWTWGSVEAGRPAVFASYEAFAPLVATQLAQYAKLLAARPPAGRPTYLVLLSSLGWANSPTHQNSDLAGTFVARAGPRVRLVCPFGASSAARRVDELLFSSDSLVAVVCSKQPLLDLPDPGGRHVRFSIADGPEPELTIIAFGDVCVTEAVAAMAMAAPFAFGVEVIAVAEVGGAKAMPGPLETSGRTVLGVSWCAPALAAAVLWPLMPTLGPLVGYEERWGATAWETLNRNGMDRFSLLKRAGDQLPAALVHALERDGELLRAHAGEGVPEFAVPQLRAVPIRR